jgi:hypothetical protein
LVFDRAGDVAYELPEAVSEMKNSNPVRLEARGRRPLILCLAACVLVVCSILGCSSIERKLLFYPSHHAADNGLAAWTRNGEIIGYSRPVASPSNIWLMIHGNAGQACDRAYAIASFSPNDSVFILEYPGYGNRKGTPSRKAFNKAAEEAYLFLREQNPKLPICVVAESIGSGPGSSLTKLNPPPDKLVLIVPFDKLSLVARDHFPAFVVALLLRDNWDNVESLSTYKGPVEIFAAEGDTVIAPSHAKALAAAIPSSKLTVVKGGHNDWAAQPEVRIRNQ